MILRPSPNFGPRQSDTIDMLVLHYTGMETAEAALDRLCDPAAEVSAHYVIDEDGAVYSLVEESQRAWHAGLAFWRGQTDINSRSIGIELVNPGHEFGLRPFPKPQIQTLTQLSLEILRRHPIPARNVVGHSDIAPSRKQDPGELFPWRNLALSGIGAWPLSGNRIDRPLTEALTLWGYDTMDEHAAISAFQRHYRPASITGEADKETTFIASGLVTQFA
jgi:N-acetylmuramoyl-L-alanine amidase